MNYLITFEKPIPIRAAKIEGEIRNVIFWDTDPEKPRHNTEPYIKDIDDVIEVMSKHYPEVQNYEIRETLLSLKDLEENDKLRKK